MPDGLSLIVKLDVLKNYKQPNPFSHISFCSSTIDDGISFKIHDL